MMKLAIPVPLSSILSRKREMRQTCRYASSITLTLDTDLSPQKLALPNKLTNSIFR
jgi:hypothetical protein